MSRDKQNEIHELAKQMSEAISTAVEQRYIEDEAKLQAVLIENGWRKASEVAREIFEEIEKTFEPTVNVLFYIGETLVDVSKWHIDEKDALDKIREYMSGTICSKYRLRKMLAELKKKYTEGGE